MCYSRSESLSRVSGSSTHFSTKVLEETGYDLSNKLRKKDCVEISIKEQSITLYIVGGVPEDYPFETKTRKEISVSSQIN